MNGLEGSIESTPTSRSCLRSSAQIAPISVLLPTPGGPGEADDPRLAGAGIQLGHQAVALGIVVLDQADRPRQRALVAADETLGERVAVCSGASAKAASWVPPP